MSTADSSFIAGVGSTGAFYMLPSPVLDHAVGDRRYLPGGLSMQWALRPAVFTDLPDHLWMRPNLWMLARSFPDIEVDVRVLVALPAHMRANNSLNILLVTRMLAEQASTVGPYVLQLEGHAQWARDQSPRPIFEHREVLFLERNSVSERQDVSEEAQQ